MHNNRLIAPLSRGWPSACAKTLIILSVLGIVGCTSFGAAHIKSTPLGAEVINLEDDSILGITPVKVWWRGDTGKPKHVAVRFQKQGYRDKVTAFWVNMRHQTKGGALSDPAPVNVQLERKGAR